jgi:CBS domain-containing protein
VARFHLAPAFLNGSREQNRKVKTVMSPGAVTVTEDSLARDVADLMYRKNIKRVRVLRDCKLVGVVARSDLVRALATKLAERPPSAPAEDAE